MSTCEELGVLLPEYEQEGPSSQLIILGIELDTVLGHLYLPTEKLDCLRWLLGEKEQKEGLHQKRAGIPHLEPKSRVQGCHAWLVVCNG